MKHLIKIISVFFILAIPVLANAADTEKWNSVEGLKRLKNSKFNNDFYQLANYYQPQINPLYCSVATGVMLMNALNAGEEIPSQKENEIKKPEAMGGGVIEFHSYSQLGFLNEKTDKIKKREIIQLKEPKEVKNGEKIYDAGVALGDYAKILNKAYGLKVKLHYVEQNDEKSIQKFRDDVKKYLAEDKKFIVVNFDGKMIGNKTKGHISPLAAYDEESDSILVLDAALHKNTWYWVQLPSLYKAMNTKDGDNYRGYLIVGK
ncbi:MAG: hypothetical protein KGQ36_02705 [Rickettsiales bacterium]|nr:hypothetical protein [Rickettsiales bacterium]